MKKTIPVIGMACSVCAANVERKLNSLDGINSATVSLAGRTALVDFNPEQISLEDMKREISNAGYDLVIEEDRSAEEINRREFTLLKRKTIGSWIFSLLVMAFSMGWISMGAESELAARNINNQMALIIALASSVMFPWSTFHIVNFCPISQSSKSNVCPLASAGAIDRHTVMHAACHVFCLMFMFLDVV
jgi:copper chaperone CopZ